MFDSVLTWGECRSCVGFSNVSAVKQASISAPNQTQLVRTLFVFCYPPTGWETVKCGDTRSSLVAVLSSETTAYSRYSELCSLCRDSGTSCRSSLGLFCAITRPRAQKQSESRELLVTPGLTCAPLVTATCMTRDSPTETETADHGRQKTPESPSKTVCSPHKHRGGTQTHVRTASRLHSTPAPTLTQPRVAPQPRAIITQRHAANKSSSSKLKKKVC